MAQRLTPKFKRNLGRIIPFGIIWLLTSWVLLASETIATRNTNLNPDTDISLTWSVIIFANLAVLTVGMLVGTVEMVILQRRFRNFSLMRKIIYKFGFYLVFMLLIISITFPIAAVLESELTFFSQEVWAKTRRFFTSLTFLSTIIQLSFSLLLSLIYSAISENLGHNVLFNLFTGKYHSPKNERRIFMFLDMKDSTKIAEELGHVKYFQLLREYYDIMSDSIINSKGEVYQYIGDEVVVSWDEEIGIENNNCVRCFDQIKQNRKKKSDFFQGKFGVVPDFKAGIHIGEVTTGEIGALKKEIVFTGDVLNTTSRIQSLCKVQETDLILSEELLSRLKLEDGFKTKLLGEFELKGKSERMKLHSINF